MDNHWQNRVLVEQGSSIISVDFSNCELQLRYVGGITAGLISDYTGGRGTTCCVMLILAAPMVSLLQSVLVQKILMGGSLFFLSTISTFL